MLFNEHIVDWLHSQLSPEQYAPAFRETSHACILASAGSGKTRTLVSMLVADLMSGVAPSEIVAFTFTEKAASELLNRVMSSATRLVPDIDLSDMFIGTIHAWAFQYLLSIDRFFNFGPLDELQVDILVSRVHDQLVLDDVYGTPYPKDIPPFLRDLEVFYNEHIPLSEVPERIRPAIHAWEEILWQNRLLCFGSMIRYAINELTTSGPLPSLRRLYVDEYQDVNPAQVALIKAMIPKECSLVVVGDDLQCIYQWRGSDVGQIVNFQSVFEDAGSFSLKDNYRSRPDIIYCANSIAKNVKYRAPKDMLLKKPPDGIAPNALWLSAPNELAQAQVIAQSILKLHESGTSFRSIIVLLRSVVRDGPIIADTLEAFGIPVFSPVLNRGGRFIELFLIPVVDWLRSKHFEPRNAYEEKEFEVRANNLWHTVSSWFERPDEDVFWNGLLEWKHLIDESNNVAYNVRHQLYKFLDICGLRVSEHDPNLAAGIGIASQIIRSVEEVHRRRLKNTSRRTPLGIMNELYYALQRNARRFGESTILESPTDAVLISTVHQAKGLEWAVVILPSLVKNKFPGRHYKYGSHFADDVVSRYGTTLEDERRLFYVAVTRAKERLLVIDSVNGNPRLTSRFLYDCALPHLQLDEVPVDYWHLSDVQPSGTAESIALSLSDILLFVECPFQYGLRKVIGVQPPIGDELGFGQSLHELIQRRIQEGFWNPSTMQTKVDEYVHLPYMSDAQEAHAKNRILSYLEALEEQRYFDVVTETELPIRHAVEGGIVSGIVDSIRPSENGHVVIDWKSSVHEEFLSRYERQLQFYSATLSELGYAVTGAEIVDVRRTADSSNLVRTTIDVSLLAQNRIMDEIRNAVRDIRDHQFDPVPAKDVCKACDVSQICGRREP